MRTIHCLEDLYGLENKDKTLKFRSIPQIREGEWGEVLGLCCEGICHLSWSLEDIETFMEDERFIKAMGFEFE